MDTQGCAWCGETPLSREHLLPQWLSDVLVDAFPAEDGYEFAYVFTTSEGEGPLRAYSPQQPELVVRAVCTACNNGWMAALEGRTKKFLEPMVRGEILRLSIAEQATLAHWAAKVAALLDHYESGAVVLGPSDADEIAQDQAAPAGFHIRLAYRADEHPDPFDIYLSSHYASPAETTEQVVDEAQANAFSVTLGIGRVAIAVVGGPGLENPERWRHGSDFPLMIWPPTPGGIEWPPRHPVLRSHDDLRAFHESFWNRILNPGFPRPDALGRLRAEDDS